MFKVNVYNAKLQLTHTYAHNIFKYYLYLRIYTNEFELQASTVYIAIFQKEKCLSCELILG